MMRTILRSLCAVGLVASIADAAQLDPASLGLPPLQYAAIAWAPADTGGSSSGRSLLAISGLAPDGIARTYIARVALDGAGRPQVVGAIDDYSVMGVIHGSLDWADFDHDGDLDLAISGRTANYATAPLRFRVYRQLSGSFSALTPADDFPFVPAVDSCTVRWVDYDVDGDMDLFVVGRNWTSSKVSASGDTILYGKSELTVLRNDAAGLTGHRLVIDTGVESGVDQIMPFQGGDLDFGDMDGDGDFDLVIAGTRAYGYQGDRQPRERIAAVYENKPPGVFNLLQQAAIAPQANGGVVWGDFDRDRLLDIAISGYDNNRTTLNPNGSLKLVVYRNTQSGTFALMTNVIENLHAVAGRLAAMDIDNDGWLDLVSLGRATSGAGGIRYYRNRIAADSGSAFERFLFANTSPPLIDGAFALGHLDGDGTPDLIAAGRNGAAGETQAWTVSGMPANAAPTTPIIGWPTVTGDRVVFTWTAATDAGEQLISYEISLLTGDGLPPLIVTRAAFGPGAHGRNASFVLRRSLPQGTGMPLRIRAVDASGHTSKWSVSKTVQVQDFVHTIVEPAIVPVFSGSAAWVDVDRDGSPDLAINGFDQTATPVNRLYLNDRGRLVPNLEYTTHVPPLYQGQQVWGDVDGDGYPDVLVVGQTSDAARAARLYLNRSYVAPGAFATAVLDLVPGGITGARAAMGDIDNDGDVDIVMTGIVTGTGGAAEYVTYMAVNEGLETNGLPSFTVTKLALRPTGSEQGFFDGAVSLADIDKDGDLDLTLQGTVNGGDPAPDDDYMFGYLEVYKNEGALRFVPWHGWGTAGVAPNLPVNDTRLDQLGSGQHAWADVDGDGDLDLVAVGFSRTSDEFHHLGYWLDPESGINFKLDGSALRIYKNDGTGTLRMAQADSAFFVAALAVADMSNDGWPDILITGYNDHLSADYVLQDTRYYENTGDGSGTFTAKRIPLLDGVGVAYPTLAPGDFDGDGDVDVLVAGNGLRGDIEAPRTTLLSNTNGDFAPNVAPSAPGSLAAATDTTDAVRLSWGAGSDMTTPAAALTYALRVGTVAGADLVRSGAAPVGYGPLGTTRAATIGKLADGRYGWSVRAIDAGFARSPWASAGEFIIDTTPPKVASVLGTLTVGADDSIRVTIDFDDALTGVDPDAGLAVTLSVAGRSPVPVERDRWAPGDQLWIGSVAIPAGTFITEPVRIAVTHVRDHRGNAMRDTAITADLYSAEAVAIAPERGGMIRNSAKTISLYIPPDGFDREVGIVLAEPPAANLPAGLGPLILAARFSATIASVSALSTPAVLSMSWRTVAARTAGAAAADPANYRIYRLLGSGWDLVGGTIAADSISAPIAALGTYALFDAAGTTSVETLSDLECTPRAFSPGSADPAAYSDRTVISFSIASADAGGATEVLVYDADGRRVRELSTVAVAGANALAWDGNSTGGSRVPSGMYIVVVKAGGRQKTRTVVVLNKYAR